MERKLGKLKIESLVTYLIICFMLVAIVFCAFKTNGVFKSSEQEITYRLEDGWTVDNKETSLPYEVTFEKSSDSVTFSRIVDEQLYRNNYLYIRNYKLKLFIYINDNLVYSVNNEEMNKSVHLNSHFLVYLKDAKIGDTLKVTYSNIDDLEISATIKDIKCGTKDGLFTQVKTDETVTIISLWALVFFGMTFISFLVAAKKKNVFQTRFISFGLFLVDGVIWLINDSALIDLTSINPIVSTIVAELSFACMPLGILFFIKRSFKDDYPVPLINSTIITVLANLLFKSSLLIFNLFPIQYLNITDQILIIWSIIVSIIYIYKFIKIPENKKKIQPKILISIFLLVLLFGTCAIICFYLYDSFIYHLIITIAILLFIFGLIVLMIFTHFAMLAEKEKLIKQSERFKELSYKDELTSLGNTRLFDEELQQVEFFGKEATLVIIDVNNIKRVNDTYGHGAGDNLILQCAECMQKTFVPFNGKCFRIGGDEFAALIYPDADNPIDNIIDNFNNLVKVSSGDRMYKLSVAVGYAKFGEENNTAEKLKFNADLSMYQDKTHKKRREEDTENETWKNMINTIISIFEVKDVYTASHSNRVSHVAKFIAEQMDVTALFVNDVFLAGSLHDIGKIGISDKILTKKGKLNDEEFAEIKKHPEIGERIILSSGGMKKIGNIVRHHHEKYNGSGYPDHLSGDEIPLESRILTMADCIDAMTSDRCYRKALSYEECRADIERNAGILFDPNVAKVTLEHWDELVTIHKELKK